MHEKIVIVKRQTQLEELLHRHATQSQVEFYLQSRGDSYQFYLDAHDTYTKGLDNVRKQIGKAMRVQEIDKEYLPTFQFGEKDLVVVVGDPGLFVNTAKYVGKQEVMLVNPDKERFDDLLATCMPEDFKYMLDNTLQGKVDIEPLTMAEARLDDGQVLYALNDFFIGRKTHVSARYVIEHNGKQERQSSSGIIVTTGTGSTAWVKSFAYTISKFGGHMEDIPFSRSAPYLRFTVREAFPSKITGGEVFYGKIQKTPLRITSQMPEEGVIFSDGIESDNLDFPAGSNVIIQPSQKSVYRIANAKS